jgi:hypothetical protein
VNVPIKRGTARRLGLRQPLRTGENYAPLGFRFADIDPEALQRRLNELGEKMSIIARHGIVPRSIP